jgi:murein L,D-transpeptidase YcbB/YkuD
LTSATTRSLAAQLHESERTARALDEYRALAARDDGELLPSTEDPVKPGDTYDGIPRLIRLLSLVGDLPADAVPSDSRSYTDELAEAVKKFQSRHGLPQDGIIGPATLKQLNTPLSVRVRQLELALERWRRHPYDPARPAIVLNVPEFRLRAFSGTTAEGDAPDLEMKVVVGEAPDHKSPLLHSHLDSVVFRPYWTVPAAIQKNELLPEIQSNAHWVSDNNFEMVTRQGQVAEADGDLAHTISELSTGRLQLRQKPGPKNTLGLVKFLFPNDYGVYMHDTSAHWLFEKDRRDLSHGCIRVERPEDLAEWVLRGQSGWSRDRVEEAIRGEETIAVRIKRPIQFVIMYVTAVVMESGEVHFLDDIYGEDSALEKGLVAQRQ